MPDELYKKLTGNRPPIVTKSSIREGESEAVNRELHLGPTLTSILSACDEAQKKHNGVSTDPHAEAPVELPDPIADA